MDPQQIESIKKNRKVKRAIFTKTANELDTLLKSENPSIVRETIEVVWECLKSKYEILRSCEEQVYDAMLESAEAAELIADKESYDAYERRFTELRLKSEKLLELKPNEDDQVSSVSNSTGHSLVGGGLVGGKRKFKLPQIEFKQFDGDIKEWLAFWAQFKKINDDTCIDESDKIEYLLQATVPGSRARQIVESFPVIGDNYQKIIDCLKSRFGREDLQIEVYVRELLKLVLNNAMSHEKLEISTLYDQIETQLRALDTLGITSDKYAALLFPLIESCLPQELLRIWQRSSFNLLDAANSIEQSVIGDITLEIKLKKLMSFLGMEVQNELRISLASEGFGLAESVSNFSDEQSKKSFRPPMTAAGLVNANVARCMFCNGTHDSETCFKAQKMSLEEKRKILRKNKACFRCLKIGHQGKYCRTRLKCILCGVSHVPLMCPNLKNKKEQTEQGGHTDVVQRGTVLTNQTNTHVFLQTIVVNLKGDKVNKTVRALIDSGSQRSYILKATASALGLKTKRITKVLHCLFGGTEAESTHYCHDITIFKGKFETSIEVLDQPYICTEIQSIFYGPWIQELKSMNIEVSDFNKQGQIELLLGADVIGKLYTGRRRKLRCGVVAIETYLGWTLEGKVPVSNAESSHVMTTISLFVKPSISDLWQLDVLGIQEPTEQKSKEEIALAAKELFLQTVNVNEEGRYEVRLPWLDGHPQLPTNYTITEKRLESTVYKLKKNNVLQSYNDVFREWESMNIIERVECDIDQGHFLPHRAVLKENSTTAVRPVFDASAREKNYPSLNQCLEKGLNLIEKIPALLIKFREHKIGVTSDIKKAFLQISVHEKDRKFLKFLWQNEEGQEIVYRHRRVVFGLNCSPFMLGATIEYHLSKCLKYCALKGCKYTREMIEILTKSFYVDNCVTSLPNEATLHKFIKESVDAMAEAQFDLRCWEFSGNSNDNEHSLSILGLKWFTKQDVLSINPELVNIDSSSLVVTKRSLLSISQKVFDPIGFTSPATLIPKMFLQKLWKDQITWDSPINDDIASAFKKWIDELPQLKKIKISRWIHTGNSHEEDVSIHTFVDASKDAYSTVIFCRVKTDSKVLVYLLAAKSRVAPVRKVTIPRLELLAATIGARLYTQTVENLQKRFRSFFWTDSSTVISWLQRDEEWGTFVWNRVQEIRKLTSAQHWRHVPGECNPADLPSRGCMPRQLFESKWWEGPRWLYLIEQDWPSRDFIVNEEEVTNERKRKLVTALVNVDAMDFWHLKHFSRFFKTLRMIAWIFRYLHNVRHRDQRNEGDLSVKELDESENFVVKMVQTESFVGLEDERIKCLNPFYDENGIIRLKSRVSNRKDTRDYRLPMVLPGKHPVIVCLILDVHRRACHVGTQGIMSLLRERYWILGGRRAIRSALKTCGICRRHDMKPFVVNSPPLPMERVRDAVPFEVSGVDFAGPLYLKSGEKAWICLFTCAVYRAIHLELTLSLSAEAFLRTLRRFVARRGRPKILYSDNGTNFRGADNLFSKLDWERITIETTIQRITWRFNPPSASWWGGFFERLIGLVKTLLRRMLGSARLDYEELMTLLCDCEAVVNSRPLTYVSNDPEDLMPLTPAMFLREQAETGMPDCNEIDKTVLSRRARNIQALRDNLHQRFRLEYLGQLQLLCDKRGSASVKLNDVVLISNDNLKRVEWPIGRITEVIPGKDGITRLVRLKTKHGELLRPVQRLVLLESSCGEFEEISPMEPQQPDCETTAEESERALQRSSCAGVNQNTSPVVRVTRSGRTTKIPRRYL